MKKRIKHLVWDWNGTLLEDVAASVAAINTILAEHCMPRVTEQSYRDNFGFPVQNYYIQLGFDFSKTDWHALAGRFHEIYDREAIACGLRPGIPEVLSDLRGRNLPMSVLSASKQSILERMINERSIVHFFRQLRGISNMLATSKLEAGRELAQSLGCEPDETLMVGDTSHDHEVASALGWNCVILAGGHQSPARFRQCACQVISHPSELLSLMP